jgi:hypothetical protein
MFAVRVQQKGQLGAMRGCSAVKKKKEKCDPHCMFCAKKKEKKQKNYVLRRVPQMQALSKCDTRCMFPAKKMLHMQACTADARMLSGESFV